MKYEKEFREAHPETTGEKDSHFDLYNYCEWLEHVTSEKDKELADCEEFADAKIKTVQDLNRQLSDLHDDIQQLKENNDSDFQVKRVYDWLMDDNREPAQTKFTAGELRNLSREIEFRLWELKEENERLRKDKEILQRLADKRNKIMQEWIKKYDLPITKAVLDDI